MGQGGEAVFEHEGTEELFPTRVWRFRLRETTLLNAALRDQVMALALEVPTTPRGEVSGWQSDGGFLESSAAARHLRGMIGEAIASVVCPGVEGFAMVGWANLFRRGDGFSPHTHSNSALSGAYYVDVGDGGGGGELVFRDPRGGAAMIDSGLSDAGQGCAARFMPESGHLVIFPSFLLHWVTPYRGERPRISIAFNAW